jgi:pimeloyl-ACP methyl ester carboxylesterase
MKQLYNLFGLLVLISAILSCNNFQRSNPVKKELSDQGVHIAYQDTGKGEVTLLFVHGWAINKSYWLGQEGYFADKYRVIAIDLPGFGQSGKNRDDWSVEAYARDINTVIKQLHLKNVILIGHSMSGDIVLQAALQNRYGIIGIIGIDNFKNYGHQETAASKKDFASAIDEMRQHFKKVAFDFFNQALFAKNTSAAIKHRILNDVAHTDSVTATRCMADDDFNEKEKLKQYPGKLYLINSDYTPTDTTGFKTNNIRYSVKYIHGTGHFPMIEDPEHFNLLLEQAVNDIKKDKN